MAVDKFEKLHREKSPEEKKQYNIRMMMNAIAESGGALSSFIVYFKEHEFLMESLDKIEDITKEMEKYLKDLRDND